MIKLSSCLFKDGRDTVPGSTKCGSNMLPNQHVTKANRVCTVALCIISIMFLLGELHLLQTFPPFWKILQVETEKTSLARTSLTRVNPYMLPPGLIWEGG